MFFTIEKFVKRVNELSEKRYREHICIAPFTAMEGTIPTDAHYHGIPEKIEGTSFGIHDFFIGKDKYLWLEKMVEIPECCEGCEVVARFDFGKTGGGQTGGFESLLYVNGKPYQGVDGNHKEVFFPGMTGQKVRLTFMLWTGMEGEMRPEDMSVDHRFYHQCRMAEFAQLHIKTDKLYYYAKTITDTLKELDKNREEYEELTTLLEQTLCGIDWDGDRFYETVDTAWDGLQDRLQQLKKRTDVTVNVVGHTHIDVAWLWRLKHTREKVQRSFSTVLRLMERYEDYIFLQTQPQLYKYIKEDCPEVYAKIKERISEGRWEPDGGMWVEADCNIPSGESLVRQLLYGIRFMETEFGKKCEYLWLPDVFGYSWALPQILKQCEIQTFMTTKLSWNQYNQMPNDLFWWRGMDGSKILTYFVDVPTYVPSLGITFSNYGCELTVRDVMGSWTGFKNKDLTKDVLVSFGIGDGGGGVTRDMLETRRAMDAIPGLPQVKPTRAGDFFRKIHDNVKNTQRYVHTWDGELYLEFHRGTYTTQADSKKTNRRLENKLLAAEWLSSMAYIRSGNYALKEINACWEGLLLHQFHDIIPGSSIHEVYEDSEKNYREVEKMADQVAEAAIKVLQNEQQNEDTYSVYSVNSFGGPEQVFVAEHREGIFKNKRGQVLPMQKTDKGYFVLTEVTPFAVEEICFYPLSEAMVEKTEDIPFVMKKDGIETPYYSIGWDELGQLISLYDKEADRQVLSPEQPGNVLAVYEDKPMGHDAWNLEIYYRAKKEIFRLVNAPRVVEMGNLRAVIQFTYQYGQSSLSQYMVVYRDSRRIDFKTHVDWKESNKLLKVLFYPEIRSTKATYDTQFGFVERPTHWNTSWDWAKFEVCGHKWADISETGFGVSLLNDCKYGYSIKENELSLSLLRSTKWPDGQADMGEHDFTYALLPHKGSVESGGTIEESNRLNLPAKVLKAAITDCCRVVNVSSDCIQIDAVKKAEDEDCLIVRLHECRGRREKVILSSEYAVKRIVPCNMLEHDCDEAVAGAKTVFEIKPFEICSFKLYM